MNQVHLAGRLPSDPRTIAIAVAYVVAALAIPFLTGWVWNRMSPAEPPDERATLRGSAQVLSLKAASGLRQVWGTVELEVHIPGSEPYIKSVYRQFEPEELAAAQPGMTVQVRADPDKPKRFRIDFNQPVM
ncbi:hypothetical protein A5696_01560 [Mycobacterium sp. E2699]|uniref:hypothetical protein n=1 Tax=Mycobacterium sp. E2699 TaxID=1834137 RepID=UPI0007FBBA39|nr:hypothetical protein [Mycobacterium sp. E2699]OBH07060.1 hypothetical protein A5696_01560 [Mycobacterium sp. E2699]